MTKPFLAYVLPVDTGASPEHPIAPGGPGEPGVWPPGMPGHLPQPQPPGVWPSPGRPGHLPALPSLPPGIWGGAPPSIDNTLPVQPGTPEHPIELPPGTIWPPIDSGLEGKALVLVWIPFVGFKWVIIDTTLSPEHPIAPPPAPEPR